MKPLSELDIALRFALPNYIDIPPACLEFYLHALVSLDVGRELGMPILWTGFRKGCLFAIRVSMPEAAVHE